MIEGSTVRRRLHRTRPTSCWSRSPRTPAPGDRSWSSSCSTPRASRRSLSERSTPATTSRSSAARPVLSSTSRTRTGTSPVRVVVERARRRQPRGRRARGDHVRARRRRRPTDPGQRYVFPNLRSGTGLTTSRCSTTRRPGVVATRAARHARRPAATPPAGPGRHRRLHDPADEAAPTARGRRRDPHRRPGRRDVDRRRRRHARRLRGVGGLIPSRRSPAPASRRAATTITRGNGSELGSFLDEGFAGRPDLIRLGGVAGTTATSRPDRHRRRARPLSAALPGGAYTAVDDQPPHARGHLGAARRRSSGAAALA